MNMDAFYTAIEPVFNKLKHPMIGFEYNSKTKEHISTEFYTVNDVDYTVVVRKNGSVVYGFIDGPDFNEVGTLGTLEV